MQKRSITGVALVVLMLSLIPLASALSIGGFFKWIFGGGKDVQMSPGSGSGSGSGYVPPAAPAPVGAYCNDSDGGKDYNVKGTAISKEGGATYIDEDRCLWRNVTGNSAVYQKVESCEGLTNCNLQEAFCLNGKTSNEPYVCPTGKFCMNGQCDAWTCLNGVGPNGQCNQPDVGCIMGTFCDCSAVTLFINSVAKTAAGKLKVTYNVSELTYGENVTVTLRKGAVPANCAVEDVSCTGPSSEVCVANTACNYPTTDVYSYKVEVQAKAHNIACPNALDSRVLPIISDDEVHPDGWECIDYDKGPNNSTVKSNVTMLYWAGNRPDYRFSVPDSCVGEEYLNESWCNGQDVMVSSDVDCPVGYSCADGACRQRLTYPTEINSPANVTLYTPGPVRIAVFMLKADSCVYSIDGDSYVALVEEANEPNLFTGYSKPLSSGTHMMTAYCADFMGRVSNHANVTFNLIIWNTTCTDSDGGLNYYVVGNTIGLYGGRGSFDSLFDDCDDLHQNWHYEYYCLNSEDVNYIYHTCQYGCEDRLCLTGTNGPMVDIFYPDSINYTTSQVDVDILGVGNCSYSIDSGPLVPLVLYDRGRHVGVTAPLSNGMHVLRAFCTDSAGNLNNRQKVTFGVMAGNVTTCTDSDGGLNYFVKGNVSVNGVYVDSDWCTVTPQGDLLNEKYCRADGSSATNSTFCQYGCEYGACRTTPVQPAVCPELVNHVKNVGNFERNGILFEGRWNDTWRSQWWINGIGPVNYTEYYRFWSTTGVNDSDSVWHYMTYSVDVFDDPAFDARVVLKENVDDGICQIRNYYVGPGEDNVTTFYVCNWNVMGLTERDSYQLRYLWDYRSIVWAHDNVLVRVFISEGKWLTDDEFQTRVIKETNKLVSSLGNNYFRPVYEELEIDYPMDMAVYDALDMCPSTVPRAVNPETNEPCYTSWQCKIEPTVCPEYGEQKRICVDYGSCQLPMKTDTLQCSPGICSGCYVPRWMGYNNGNNVCIPYGIRLAFEGAGDSERVYEDVDFDGDIYRFNFTVISDNSAYLYLEEADFDGVIYEGQEIYLKFMDGGQAEEITFTVDKIVQGSDGDRGYMDITVMESFNAYCDIDGDIKPQRSKEKYTNNWAMCQNNYECTSNVCSGGECIEIQDMLNEGSRIKALGVKILCGLAHPMDEDRRATCVYNFLGAPATPTSGGSGGGGSGGGSSG